MTGQDLDVIEAMEKYGGSFVQAVARAARHADERNLHKIKLTWTHEWNQYAEYAAKTNG